MSPLSLNAVVDGDLATKPALILGHSLGTNVHAWDDVVPLLTDQFALLRFDLPGHGESPVAAASFTLTDVAAAVVALADSLEIDQFDYAGVSVCGGLALELAHHYPDRVRHVAVVCSAPFLGGPDGWRDRIAHIQAHGMDAQLDGLAERWFSPTTRAAHPELVQKLVNMVAAADPAGYVQVCEAIASFDARGYLDSITVPTLVISGELDTGTPPAAGKVIADTVPGSRQVVIADASHQAAAEHPEQAAAALREFFAA